MANARPASHLVVIGSSAGGIDALSVLVATLPNNFGAPIVLAQHLDPTRPSHLGDILARRTSLPVHRVEGHEQLKPGVIYVVPANHNVYITDSAIEVRIDGEGRAKPSVDLLLTSAAEVYGEQLIAVILSGTGSDGATGARAVKKAGGTVIIQDPDTASYPGMPLSLAPTTVDIVANVDRIGPILTDLLAGLPVPTRPDEKKAFEVFLEDVRDRFGLDFNSYKTPTILRRLQRRFVATDIDNLEGYIQYLRSHPEEYQQLINAFLIKVTEFFRDPEVFTYLRESVLPQLIDYSRRHGNDLRIWSAGCATGEEAYTLAILFSEVLGASLEHFNVRIFATDADAEAIAFARRGIYPAQALVRLPEEMVSRYFSRDDGNFQVRKRVRSLTVFGQHDLGQRAPFPHIDLVVCRNVLIYFTPDLQQRTLKLFAYSLRDSGYLVLGKAESPGQMGEFFVLEDRSQKVYRRQGDRILIPPARIKEPAPAPPRHVSLVRRAPGSLELAPGQRELQHMRATTDGLLSKLPVGVVVVDRHYDIQALNSAARRFLSIHGPAFGEDLIHLAQDVPSQLLRAAIDAAFRQGTTSDIAEFSIKDLSSDEQRYFQVTCHPQRIEGEDEPTDTVMVVVQDITSLVQARRAVEEQLQLTSQSLAELRGETQEEATRHEQVSRRLVETNRQLLEANQELTSANEELRTTNEEFLLSNEEAQAAIEEVETLNEELQAINEELETLNEELQSTIEELNTTNDDLHARSVELQDLARISEEERAQLAAILVNMGDAVLVVDRAGKPVLTNAAYERLFGGAGQELALQDENGHPLRSEHSPQQRAARGESFNMEFTLIDGQRARRWFEANGQPIGSADGGQQGGVVVIRDITERSLHRLQEEFLALASHELRTPLTPLQTSLQALVRSYASHPPDAQQRHYAELAIAQVGRLARLVDDLLDASRLQSGKYTLTRERLRFDELVGRAAETARMLAQGQQITLDVHDAPLTIDGDAQRLEQIILNLLTNAITYAPNTPRIDVRLKRAGDDAELQVQDYGPGIAPADMPHLFTRFFQVARRDQSTTRGLGLGLYIAQEIAMAHGGRIIAASTPGQGATFTLRLPLAQEKERKQKT
jgi:two-component system, chemotaxis family, CheB/CheR fusion protein